MALIVNIDTSLETASVCLAKNGNVVEAVFNNNQKDHAAWLHVAIKSIFQKTGHHLSECHAVAVSIGPGSYTGLRVGLASAKGICYALNIPLITISTLKMIALAAKDQTGGYDLICPMIDARRMEVFMAYYNQSLNEVGAPQTLIIDENSFAVTLKLKRILFCGNGNNKLQKIVSSPNAIFSDVIGSAPDIAKLSYNSFQKNEFSNLGYTEPLYIKEFYSSDTRIK
jgi:tRNA threonylcarbamoyladenosine biosynthesis protein TsaB